MSIALYILYGLIILIFLIITPLRLKARQKTLNEINELRHSFNERIKDVTVKIGRRRIEDVQRESSLAYSQTLNSLRRFEYCLEASGYLPWISDINKFRELFIGLNINKISKICSNSPYRLWVIPSQTPQVFEDDTWEEEKTIVPSFGSRQLKISLA